MSDLDSDIGRLTYELRSSAKSVYDTWMHRPGRRCEYGEQEVRDIKDVVVALTILAREIDKLSKPKLVYGR